MRSHTRKRSATAPFLLIAALVSSMVIGPSVLPASAAVRSKDLTGVWTGNWMADDGRPGGAVEMILAEDPVEGTMVAHITFIDGSQSDTVRREGRLHGRGDSLRARGRRHDGGDAGIEESADWRIHRWVRHPPRERLIRPQSARLTRRLAAESSASAEMVPPRNSIGSGQRRRVPGR
jgi:hypothetical protein